MILPNVQGLDSGAVSENETPTPLQLKPVAITATEFFSDIAVTVPGGVQGVVYCGRDGAPNDHLWNLRDADPGTWTAEKSAGKTPAYMTMSAFKRDAVSRFKGRSGNNVQAVGGFWIDVEGSEEKGGYEGRKAVLTACGEFALSTSFFPTHIVMTGSGGAHLHYVLAQPITPTEWLGRARTLVALAAQHGLKIDAQCTTDAVRIMRAPGSLHQKTGVEVQAYRWRRDNYTLAQWDNQTGFISGVDMGIGIDSGKVIKYDLSVNGEALGTHAPFSYRQAAKKCGAMRQAAQRHGQDTPEPVWMLAVGAAVLSVEGSEFAHEISSGHSDYDETETDKKISARVGGPANQIAWAAAYGAGGPCDFCEWRERCKNPAVQFGTLIDVSPPGEVGALDLSEVVGWVRDLNQRYAVVRHGSKMVIVDFKTPSMTGHGVVLGFGYLDIAAFSQILRGRFAPVDGPKDKARPLATAWLEHSDRRQYAGLVFAPGQALPSDILNLWQGFAVEPVPGDVSLWLDVLAALVPKASDRAYVLRWLAWKVQNPGGVPDTILIFKGAKGTGKNSLFDPLVLLFGRHAMLADDPELIAGRFTWHLMAMAFAVLDEAVFVGDPRQADRIKSRVTAKTMHYEQKGMDPMSGVNHCAYVMLTNHDHTWQATTDERRAGVFEVGEGLRGNLEFWGRYHPWAAGAGPAALLHYLQGIDLTDFNPRQIPKGEALRKQIEHTALRVPAAAWWHQCLSEGAVRWTEGGIVRVVYLSDTEETEVNREALRMSYEGSAPGRVRNGNDWPAVARKVKDWCGEGGKRKFYKRAGTSGRAWFDVFPPLPAMREAFTAATQIRFDD